MTVIAFDGRIVAADKQATAGQRQDKVTKLYRHKNQVLSINGSLDAGVAMVAWFKAGANPEYFPNKGLSKDDTAWLSVFELGKHVVEYQHHPVPIIIESLPYSCGSGSMAALAAMLAGASPQRAVEITCEIHTDCGMGVDVMELGQDERGSA